MSTLGELGSWALVAGGSDGLGLAFAEEIAGAGINLLLIARRQEALAEAAAALAQRHGIEVRTVAADLTDPAAFDRVAQAAEGLEVGLLVCNAGSESRFGDFLDDPDTARLNQVVALNILGPAALVHHFGGAMRARKRGGIILVGSMAGFAGSPKIAAYSAAKSFVHAFAEGLWEELRHDNVHLLCFVLGAANTPTMRRTLGFELPGLAEPAVLAREALEHLEDGPLFVTGDKQEAALTLRGLPRRDAVAQTAASAAMFTKLMKAKSPSDPQ
jgi:uncharacterized protein